MKDLPYDKTMVFYNIPFTDIQIANNSEKEWYFCKHCQEWIEGFPEHKSVSDMGMLSGRRGVAYICSQCKQELDFLGCVA